MRVMTLALEVKNGVDDHERRLQAGDFFEDALDAGF